MATGNVGKVYVAPEAGSEEMFEFICTACKDTKIVEAEKYCRDCDQHYCVLCVDFHKHFPALKNHVILDKDDVAIWGTQILSTGSATESCKYHPGKLVELFCGEHKQLCCHICVSLYHRICDGMLYIAEEAKGIDDSEEMKVVNENLEKIKTNLENKTSKQQGSLENYRCEILKQISAFRKNTNEIFDALEQKVKNEMDELTSDISSRHQEYQKACNDILIKIQQLQRQLESSVNETQTFINIKKCQNEIPNVNKAMEELPSQKADEQLLFEIDTEIETFIASLESLGTVTLTGSMTEPISKSQSASVQGSYAEAEPDTVKTVPLTYSKLIFKVEQDRRVSQYKLHTMSMGKGDAVSKFSPVKASDYEKYNMKLEADQKKCSIGGICVMPDGFILLTDHTNCKIKCLDPLYQMMTYLVMPFPPFQICPMDDQELIVSSKGNMISFVSVNKSKMELKKTIRLSHYCHGVAYNSGRIFVSDNNNKVYIHTTEGKLIKTIKKDHRHQHTIHSIFTQSRNLASSLNGTKIFVTDAYKGLVVLDKEGEVLSTFEYIPQEQAEGIYVDMDGRVFVTLFGSHKINQLNEDGTRYVCEVVNLKSDEYPVAMCIDHKRRKMIVALRLSNYMLVYDLIVKVR